MGITKRKTLIFCFSICQHLKTKEFIDINFEKFAILMNVSIKG